MEQGVLQILGSVISAACSMLWWCRYALPRSLKEYKLVCTGADKPLYAIALLRQLSAEPTVVFTASVEATRRCLQLSLYLNSWGTIQHLADLQFTSNYVPGPPAISVREIVSSCSQ